MRKLTGKCKWILAVLLVTVSMAAGCNKVKDINADVSDPSEASHKISVVATVFPYYDFARAIGGEYLDVTLLLDATATVLNLQHRIFLRFSRLIFFFTMAVRWKRG